MNPLNAKTPSTYIEVSDSQVKLAQTCMRKWAFEKLLKIPPEEDRTALVFGVGVHEGLEKLHLGASEAESVQAVQDKMGKEPGDWAEQTELAIAMTRGYTRHFFPQYSAYWQTVEAEEWFEYFPDPVVKFRGYRDNRSVLHNNPQHMAVWDFKTTSYKDGGDLGKQISTNHQLAGYSISYVREHGVWPDEIGLIFLQKPKLKNHHDCIERALNDPSLYTAKSERVTPDFANYSMAVEEEIVTTGRQMFALKRLFEQKGPEAVYAACPNFNNCYGYGRWCGFKAGCHGNKPLHKVMLGHV